VQWHWWCKPSLLTYERLRKTLSMTYEMRNGLIHISGPYQSSSIFLGKCSLRVYIINVIVFTRLLDTVYCLTGFCSIYLCFII
jgi:hypothetical protein